MENEKNTNRYFYFTWHFFCWLGLTVAALSFPVALACGNVGIAYQRFAR